MPFYLWMCVLLLVRTATARSAGDGGEAGPGVRTGLLPVQLRVQLQQGGIHRYHHSK